MTQGTDYLSKDERNNLEFQIYEKCNCLPACSSLHYTAETSQANGHFAQTMKAFGTIGKNNYSDEK